MPSDPLIGRTIDNYKILEEIGRGGMGVVYKAKDLGLDKVVAVKMMEHRLARDDVFLTRFKREAKALARLNNQNIVAVYALRETEHGLFIVMEYVDAGNLADLLQHRGALPELAALSMFKQILAAVAHAHSVGIIHRDIKPRNIMLNRSGVIKITDFGLAKILRDADTTVTSRTAGTLFYMSPEQVMGERRIGPLTDIYSLGITLYEMLTGNPPFKKEEADFEIRRRIIDGKLLPPTHFNKDISRDLTKIISKATQKKPAKRYQSVDDFLKDIKNVKTEDVRHDDWDVTIPVNRLDKSDSKKDTKKSLRIPKPVLTATLAFLFLSAPTYLLIRNYFDTPTSDVQNVETRIASVQTEQFDKTPNPTEHQKVDIDVSATLKEMLSITSKQELIHQLDEKTKALLISAGKKDSFESVDGCYVFVVDEENVLGRFYYKDSIYWDLQSNSHYDQLSGIFSGKAAIWVQDHSGLANPSISEN